MKGGGHKISSLGETERGKFVYPTPLSFHLPVGTSERRAALRQLSCKHTHLWPMMSLATSCLMNS